MGSWEEIKESIYLARFFLPLYPSIYLALFLSLLLVGLVIGRRLSRANVQPARLLTHEYAILTFIIVAAGALRFYGITFGLPANYHPDEVPKINALSGMMERGDLNPNYFLHPSLLLYSTYFMDHLTRLFAPELDPRSSLALSGRIVSALAGTFSVGLLALVGRELYSYSVGVMGGLLLAFFPLHVTCSRYLKEDSLLCFWLLLCVYIVLLSVRLRRPVLLLLAGFVAGLSASTKYSGLLTGGILFIAPFLVTRSWIPDRKFLIFAVLGSLLIPIGFLCGTPYALLNSKVFLRDFGYERKHMLRGHTQAIDAWSQYWMYHFSRSILPGLTTPTGMLSVVALGILAWRRKLEDLIVVGMVIIFYGPAEWVKAKPAPQPERYIFPCLPFLALAVAEMIHLLKGWGKSRLACTVALVALLSPVLRSLHLAYDIHPDTREQTVAWFLKNVPPGTPLYIDWQPYAPKFPSGSFDVSEMGRGAFLRRIALGSLASSGRRYLIFSSLFYDRYFGDPKGPAGARQRMRAVFQTYPIVAEFTAPSGTNGFHNPRITVVELTPLPAQAEKKRTKTYTRSFPWGF